MRPSTTAAAVSKAVLAAGALVLTMLSACGPHGAKPGNVTLARLLADGDASGEWLTAGRDWRGAYFSGLTSINAANASKISFAWQYDLAATRGQEATPIVVDGSMYVSTTWGRVVALDAASGKELWTYDPEADGQWGRYACCDVVNRGVAVANGVVYVGSTDNYLHAIDAATGKRLWKADVLNSADRARRTPSPISGIPQVAGDVVVIGNGGADFGVRGFVRAFDLKTGKLRWTFYIVPHDPKFGPQEKPYLDAALKTWDPQSDWSKGGGGTAWDGMAYDPRLHLLYVGTGNSSPYNYLDRSKGKGDNLYLASILAIDPSTGDLRWHYQTVPGEYWDYTATAKMILADLKIDGRDRQVLMQAPKNGFFYVLDRKTGELISAKPYTFENWSTGVDLKTGRAGISPAANYLKTPKLIYPSMAGGHNWEPMSFSPQTGLVYIPVADAPMVYIDTKHRPIGQRYDGFRTAGIFPEGYSPSELHALFGDLPPLSALAKAAGGPKAPASKGYIRAFDPVRGRIVWQQPTQSFADGVVSGDIGGRLNVRRADTGALIRSIDTGGSIMAAPMTYAIKGVQYIAVTVGLGGAAGVSFPPDSAAYKYGNEGRVMVFKLDGAPVPMPALAVAPHFESPPKPPPFTQKDAEAGALLFNGYCSRCHTPGPGVAPDLRRISSGAHEAFQNIVLGGALKAAGMGSFSDELTPSDVAAIHAYVSREQLSLYKAEAKGVGAGVTSAEAMRQRRQ
jgi:quinohemoprotein ethanol dehydrogenase